MEQLTRIVKAYDVRGLVPDELDEDVAEALGRAVAVELHGAEVLVGRDMRPSSEPLAEAFMRGVRAQGVDTVDLGLCSTDLVYYASGRLSQPGAMFTASHNPAQYNGLKLCRAGAEPVSLETGLAEIRDRAHAGDFPAAAAEGRHRTQDLLAEYAAHVRVLRRRRHAAAAEGRRRRRQRHGRATWSRRCSTACRWTSCRCTSSWTARSPTTPPTRSSPRTSSTCRPRSREHGCDIGLAFDGDADRMFCVDETRRAGAARRW